MCDALRWKLYPNRQMNLMMSVESFYPHISGKNLIIFSQYELCIFHIIQKKPKKTENINKTQSKNKQRKK
jgi:hypothetical protein